jgi:2-polyprenyl-3-methyl-5-hydroxy-6-metoxy-1,4-benzoquinol methylase
MLLNSLKNRDNTLTERMDDPDCDPGKLSRTYAQFGTLNKLLSGWRGIFRTYIKPLAVQGKTLQILDIGFGAGDIPLALSRMAASAGIKAEITAIDPDPRAQEFALSADFPSSIQFLNVDSSDPALQSNRYHVVISNHVIHHLTELQLTNICRDAEKLSDQLILFNDIERSRIGYILFSLIAPLFFRNSFIVEDGKTSIRRSYRQEELQKLAPEGWIVKRKFPFRLLMIKKSGGGK